MGPYQFKVNETTGGIPTITHNPHSWNSFANLLILDVQIGTGYSFLRGEKLGETSTMDKSVKYFTRFMKQFYAHHQDFRNRPVYIVGQDFFGGKMIPLYVKALYDIDKNKDEFKSPYLDLHVNPNQRFSDWIRLEGVAMGSPVIDEAHIRGEVGAYANKNGLITKVQKFVLDRLEEDVCRPAIEKRDEDVSTYGLCWIAESIATGNPVYPMFDLRNIRRECKGWFTCQKNEGFYEWAMNQAEVLKLFKVNTDRNGSVRWTWKWTDCNPWQGFEIKDSFLDSEIGTTTEHLQDILNMSKDKRLKVLIYAGENDFQVNWMGLDKVIAELNWYGQTQYNEDSAGFFIPWAYTNVTNGATQEGGGFIAMDYFTFLKVKDAGLQVHRERPELMIALLKQWMADPMG